MTVSFIQGHSPFFAFKKQQQASGFSDALVSSMGNTQDSARSVGSKLDWFNTDKLPANIDEADASADATQRVISDRYRSALANSGLSGTYGLSVVFQDGEYSVVGSLVPDGPVRSVTGGIGMNSIFVDFSIYNSYDEYLLANGDPFTSNAVESPAGAPPPYTKEYNQWVHQIIMDCIKDIAAGDDLEDYAINKGMSDYAKVNPSFRDEYNKDPMAACDKYADELRKYMNGCLFPVSL